MSGTFIDTSKRLSHFPDRVTIQAQGGGTPNARGAKNPAGNWSTVEGKSGLPAQISALERGNETPGAGEGETAISTHQILLLDFDPQITERHRVVDDATAQIYNIVLASRDPMGTVGVLKCRRVS